MMLKLITGIVIVGCSTFIGIEMAKGYVLRTKEIRDLVAGLSRLDTEISQYATRLPEAFARIGETVHGEIGLLFTDAAGMLTSKDFYTAAEAWRQALKQHKQGLHLDGEEYDILYRLGDQLGNSHAEGQRQYIRLTLNQLSAQEEKAIAMRAKYERMYKSLGVLGGLTLAILLF